MRNPQRQDIWTSIERIGKEDSSDEGKNAKFFWIPVNECENQSTDENAPGRQPQI